MQDRQMLGYANATLGSAHVTLVTLGYDTNISYTTDPSVPGYRYRWVTVKKVYVKSTTWSNTSVFGGGKIGRASCRERV
jgi:hypothetical protein